MTRLHQLKAIAASVKTRKDLEKELSLARKNAEKAQLEFNKNKRELDSLLELQASLEAKVESSRTALSDARRSILHLSESVKLMDMSGASGVKGDAYMVGGKEYHVDINDANDVDLIPYKEYKKSKKLQDVHMADDFVESEMDRDLSQYLSSGFQSTALNKALYLLKK